MNVKEMLAERFRPVPAKVADPSLDGVLFVRRLRVADLHKYVKQVVAEKGDESYMTQALLLSLAVCDKEGALVFDTPEEAADLLGENFLTIYEQIGSMTFPGAGEGANPTTPKKTRPAG